MILQHYSEFRVPVGPLQPCSASLFLTSLSCHVQSNAAAGKPGQRSIKMLDVSEAIQRKQRVGMQHRRGPVSSSPMRASFSPGHDQAPRSSAPAPASATHSSPAQAPAQAHPQQQTRSPVSAPGVPASSGLSRMQMPLQTERGLTERPASSNGTATAVTGDGKAAEDMPSEPHCFCTFCSDLQAVTHTFQSSTKEH